MGQVIRPHHPPTTHPPLLPSSWRTAFARADATTWGLLSSGTTAISKTVPCNVRVVSTHVLWSTWSCCDLPRVKGVPVSGRRTPMAIFMVPSMLGRRLPRRDVGTADDVLCHWPHRVRVLWEHVTQLAALRLDVVLQTVRRHVHATPPSA